MRPALVSFLALACATAPATTGAPGPAPADEGAAWMAGKLPADLATGAYLSGAGRGTTVDEARAAARAALLANLGSPPADVPLPPPTERVASDGKTVLLALDRSAVAAAIDAALAALPPASATSNRPDERLAHHLARKQVGDRRDALCTLRTRVGGADCPPSDAETHVEAVRTLGAELRLAAAVPAGVPFVPGQLPLQPLTVTATLGGVPWPGLPIVVTGPAGVLTSDRARTDDAGRASFTFAAPPAQAVTFEARVDRAALLGAAHEGLWPATAVALPVRALSPSAVRVAVKIAETIDNDTPPRSATAAALRRLLQAQKIGTVDVTKPIAAEGPVDTAALTEAGADVLIRGRVRCAFDSRLAARSVWYEAQAQVEVVEAWTGKVLGQLSEQAKEAGIGESHAAEKAVEAVAGRLAAGVMRVLGARYAPRLAAE